MADKYIVSGCSFCGKGDGPLIPTEAGHNDATGYAWGLTSTNTDAINILTGSAPKYGTAIAAGDTVYIRSKTSAGADLVITASGAVTFGSATATISAPITWVLDGGSKWSGINGTLSFETTGQYAFTAARYNAYVAQNHEKWILKTTTAYNGVTTPLVTRENLFGNWLVDFSLSTDVSRGANITTVGVNSTLCFWKNSRWISHQRIDASALLTSGSTSKIVMDNCIIDLIASESIQIFNIVGGSILEMLGGEIRGAGATSVTSLTKAANAGWIKTIGTKIPFEVKLNTGNPPNLYSVECMGADATVGTRGGYWWGELSSRSDGYYPHLNAVLPDSSNSAWSWWMYPSAVTPLSVGELTTTTLYSATAATATITMELLVYTGFSAVNAGTVYMVASYVDDTTGEVVTLSTKDPSNGALTASTASWSSSTYGPANFNKVKLELTTASTIKQDTLITVVLTCEAKSVNPTDVLIIDPGIQVA